MDERDEDHGHDAWSRLDLRDATRFKVNEAREEQERTWAATNVNARQIWGAREAQKLYSARLRQALVDLRRLRLLAEGPLQSTSSIAWMVPPLAVRIAEFAGSQGPELEFLCRPRQALPRPGDVLVCVRKRPLQSFELEDLGGWDAVEVYPRSGEVLCHDGRLSRSGRKLAMNHRRFVFDKAWAGASSTEEVYADVVGPLVDAALNGSGSCATLLCMGQTGTGKTYTLRGVGECLAREVRGHDVEVEFLELYGRKCLDLLDQRKRVDVRVDGAGLVRICGHRRVHLPHGGGLEEVLDAALQLRASEATERNVASSRSHAMCVLHLRSKDGGPQARLRLLDLAGSERNYETTAMTAQQHRESADINSSLMVLKNCFRAHAARQRGEGAKMPFRESRLTMLLRDCFEDRAHRFVVVATVSPAATDVIHTINTLRHASMLAAPLAALAAEVEVDLPLHFGGGSAILRQKAVIDWTPEDVLQWLSEAEGGQFAHLVVPPNLDGRRLLTTSPQGLAELFEGTLRRARGANEGEAWNVQAAIGGMYNEDRGDMAVEGAGDAAPRELHIGDNFGRELFAAARRAALAQGAGSSSH
mmetsp:Transcript_61202/g.171184  ORF Transcript_61202/g.171184 Transcript_61202/m.171184 type:complete len:588 (-) Transcript_61202:48-1811(-)